MELCVFDITLKIRIHKKVMKKTQVNDFLRTFVMKLCGVKAEKYSFINTYLFMTTSTIFMKILMITITRKS